MSIIVLSVLAAIFTLILIASIGVLIWLLLRQHRLSMQLDGFYSGIQLSIAKSLADHASTLTLLSKEIGATLETHRAKTDEQIARINGQKIESAVQTLVELTPRIAAVASRNEKAALLIIDLIKYVQGQEGIGIPNSAIERARESGLLPESYAPAAPGESYVSRSRVSSGDAEALAEESELNAQSFGDE